MLITIYEEQNSAKFSAKFTTPITLPKNTELSLIKAYIPRDHDLTINGTNDQLTIFIHSKNPLAKQVISIPHGSYGIDEFAKTLQGHIQLATSVVNSTNLGQLSNLTCAITPKIDDNQIANDSIEIYLRPQTLQPNFYYECNFNSVGNLLGTNFEETTANAQDDYQIEEGNGTLRLAVYQDNTATDKTGWDNVCILDRPIGNKWFAQNTHSDYPNSRPPYNGTHGLMSWTLGDTQGTQSSFFVGLKQHASAVDLTGITAGDLSHIDQIAGISMGVAIYGDTANGKNAGEIEVFEDVAGTFTSLGTLQNANIGVGDEIIILLPTNGGASMDGAEYFIKYFNGTIRKLVVNNAHRYIPLATQVLNPVFSFFNGSGAVDTITNLKIGMDAGYQAPALDNTKGVGMFDEYGKYIKVALGGATNDNKNLNATLGFTHDEYEEDGTGANTRVQAIEQSNDGDLKTNDSKQPYLNLNITNLPITSFSCDNNDPVSGATHDYSKCVASIPRFNQDDGHFDNLAIVFDDNTQTIKLNNKSEIILSSLDCRLQNCDGSYPLDLLTPSSFVFKVSGDNLN